MFWSLFSSLDRGVGICWFLPPSSVLASFLVESAVETEMPSFIVGVATDLESTFELMDEPTGFYLYLGLDLDYLT